ncbi:PREDICTED: nucleolin 1-like [Camelina sativa]|uniref:Nucleolin 1-like n=1 Tax=Camelina sativa TaxID=90675 RepID=A0ABM0TBF7_CAMSA|nr:PREDICTED: nucleolin 1-like [Camelina sativa]
MDESAGIRRDLKSLDLNDRVVADSPKPKPQPQPRTTISVEGYDTRLCEYALKLALKKHFSSCGRVGHIYVPRDYKNGILKSVSFMFLSGEGVEEKALELNGTDVGGWTVIVKAAPSQTEYMDPPCPVNQAKIHRVRVTGFDTSLPEIDLQMALCDHFPSCGEVWQVRVLSSIPVACIYLRGKSCVVDKALNLNGCNMGGMNLAVEPNQPQPGDIVIKRERLCTTTGYVLPSVLIRASENKKKKLEMEIEMEMNENKKKKMKIKLAKLDKEIQMRKENKVKLDMERKKRLEMENLEMAQESLI